MHSVNINGQHVTRPWGDRDEDDHPCPQRGPGLKGETESWTVLKQWGGVGTGYCECREVGFLGRERFLQISWGK